MEDKPVVIVTGSSRGIGLSIVALLLKKMNACVIAMARQKSDALAALEEEYRDRMEVTLGDIIDPKASQEAVQCAIDKWGHLDGLILNAGVIEPLATIESVPVDNETNPALSWRSLFEVNFFSLIHTIQASLPELRNSKRGARIIMVSSGSSVKGYHGTGPYGASKAAMNSLARTLAVEEPTITSLTLRPGPVDTNMQGQIRASQGMHPSDVSFFRNMHASNSLLTVEEAAYVLASLVLTAPSSLSGGDFNIDDEECIAFRQKN